MKNNSGMVSFKKISYFVISITALYVGKQISNEPSLQNNEKYIIYNDSYSHGSREGTAEKNDHLQYKKTTDYRKYAYYTKTTKIKSENFSKQNTQENIKTNIVKVKSYRETIRVGNVKNYYNQYTYDDPTSYKGPIIESWPPSKSRWIAPYMNEPFTTIPWRKKFENKTLIVIVQSTPSDTKFRGIWRKTWGNYANTQTSVLFLLGRLPDIKHETEAKILEEKNQYGDIIEVNGLIENYNNLTFKSLYTLKFFLDHGAIPQGAPQYVLKVDTDSAVILPTLYNQLTTKYKNINDLMLGRCYCCGGGSDIHCKPIRPITKTTIIKNTKYSFLARLVKHSKGKKRIIIRPEDHPYKKWAIPRYIYNGEQYPSYLSGPGYVLSRSSAECIYNMALKTPLFPMEDIFITGFLAQQCNIKRRDHTGFSSNRPDKFNFEIDILKHLNCGMKSETCEKDILTIANKYTRFLKMGLIKS